MGRNTSLYYYKIQSHQKQIRNSIRKMANWEMSQSHLSSPETMFYQNSTGVFLLGIIIIIYLLRLRMLKCHRRRSGNLCLSISKEMLSCSNHQYVKSKILQFHWMSNIRCQTSHTFLRKIDSSPSKVNLFFKMKHLICQENSAIHLKNIVFLCLSILLILAGDVELNPGPYEQELLANLVKDLAPVKQHYLQFGVQLGIALDEIECFEKAEMGDPGRVLLKILDFWLNNSDESSRFTKLCAALEFLKRNDLIDVIKKKYSSCPFQVTSNPQMSFSTSCVSTDSALISQSKNSGISTEIPSSEGATFISQSTISSPNDSEKPLEKFQEDIIILHDDSKYTVYYQALDSEDMKHKSELEQDTIQVIDHYTKILDGLYTYLSHTPHAIDHLQHVLQGWVVIGPIKKDDRYQHITQDEVEDIQDFYKLWRIFSRFCSFFNFKLLKRIIKVAEYDRGMQEIKEYKKVFKNYLKQRVTRCPSGIGMKGDDHVVLLVKLDESFNKCDMKHLKTLGKDICKIIQVEEGKLQIESVGKGSIYVTFHLHNSALPRSFFLTDQEIKSLKNLRYMEARILTIECGSVHYIINDTDKGSSAHLGTSGASFVFRAPSTKSMASSDVQFICGSSTTAQEREIIKQEVAKYKRVTVMVAGKARNGKSTALNNIFGVSVEAQSSAKSVTAYVQEVHITQNDVQVRVIDTPGLQALDLTSRDVLRKISRINLDDEDFTLLYCHSVSPNTTVTEVDIDIIKRLTFLYGNKIWERCILVLTFCDTVRNKLFPTNVDNKAYKQYLRYHTELLKKAFSKCKVSIPPVRLIFDGQPTSQERCIIAVPAAKSKDHGIDPSILPGIHLDQGLYWTDYVFLEILKNSANISVPLIPLRYNLHVVDPSTIGGACTAIGGAVGGAIGGAVGGAIGGAIVGGVGSMRGAIGSIVFTTSGFMGPGIGASVGAGGYFTRSTLISKLHAAIKTLRQRER